LTKTEQIFAEIWAVECENFAIHFLCNFSVGSHFLNSCKNNKKCMAKFSHSTAHISTGVCSIFVKFSPQFIFSRVLFDKGNEVQRFWKKFFSWRHTWVLYCLVGWWRLLSADFYRNYLLAYLLNSFVKCKLIPFVFEIQIN